MTATPRFLVLGESGVLDCLHLICNERLKFTERHGEIVIDAGEGLHFPDVRIQGNCVSGYRYERTIMCKRSMVRGIFQK